MKSKASLALEVAQQRPVFPLARRSKIPCKGSRGHLEATQDLEMVAALWRGAPEANIGTPVLEGELVLDLDPRNGSDDSAAKLDAAHGTAWRDTRTHRTRSGGRQYIYTLPEGVTGADLRGKLDGYPGVDVRKLGNYVVWPGSEVSLADLGSEGVGLYEVERDRQPAEAPAWLVETLQRPTPRSSAVEGIEIEATELTRYGRAALDDECRELAATPEGGREVQMATVACFNVGQLVAGGQVPLAIAVECVTAAALDAGLSRREVGKVEAKIREGMAAGARGPDAARLTVEDLAGDGPPALIEPSMIPETGFVRDVVDLIGPYTEAPDEAIALAAITALSAAVGYRCTITWGRSTEPLTLMSLAIGLSAIARKTTGTASVLQVFYDSGMRRLVARRVGHMSGRGLVELAIEAQAPDEDEAGILANMIEEERRRYPVGLLLLVDEFGQMLADSQWREDTLTQLLGMYSGHHSGISTGAKKAPGARCALALIGTVTTEELSRVLTAGHGRNGLLGRFLLAPHSSRKPRLAVPPPKRPGYDALEQRCLDWLRALGRWNGDLGDAYKLFDADALDAYTRWYNATADDAEKRDDDLVTSLFQRGQSKVVKLATVLAVAEVSDPSSMSADNVTVRRRHVEAAIEMEQASSGAALELVRRTHLAQRDRWCDAVVAWLVSEQDGEAPLSKVLERGVAKEAGDKTLERGEKIKYVEADPRLEIVPSTTGTGRVVKVREV